MADNIIFVDIDGVICTDRAYYSYGHHHDRKINRAWDKVSIGMINQLIKEFNLITVISSSWRLNYPVPEILLSHGYNGEFHADDSTPRKISSNRAMEISMWLDDHPEVENYLILDDVESGWSLSGSDLKQNTVMCDSVNGMLAEHYLEARKICKNFK